MPSLVTDSERELLDKLQEECAEVIHACAKVKNFGWDSSYNGGLVNRDYLHTELGGMAAVLELMDRAGIISEEEVLTYGEKKLQTIGKHLRFQ